MSALIDGAFLECSSKKIHNISPNSRLTPIKITLNQPVILPKTSPRAVRSNTTQYKTFVSDKNVCVLEVPNLYSNASKLRQPIKYSKAHQLFSSARRPEKFKEDHRAYISYEASLSFRNAATPTRGMQPAKIKKSPKSHRRTTSVGFTPKFQMEGKMLNGGSIS
ncbi:unnamed protein product [Blepharisma stoltei]|uniref:Uncharacterized protein n=1 Tax=Blepharisma stoltei TaxID=1481888 RepID=A0AAU9JYG5_9CILI|nr:unnamed protein product [Blepharisma stoltei]